MNNVRVGDIGTTITGKTPSTKYSEYFDGDIMFVTPVDLKQNYYINRSERYITDAGLDSIKKNSISGKSVLVGCIGSDLGNIAMVNEKCATNQQINSITNFKSEYSPEYVYYWFTTKKAWLRSIAGNTTTPIINKTDFDNITIQFPDRVEQDKIVSVLSTIDEKISTNNKIIETLEKLMREIYDYWFVQFDFPDENGRPYKSSGGEMVYNETLKREIPKGWSAAQLKDIADVKSGFSFSSEDYVSDGEYKIITIKNVQDGFIDYDTDNTIGFIPDKMPAWCELGSSEILMSLTGNTGRIGLTFGEQALLNQRVAKIEPKDKASNPFLYVLLGSDSVQSKIQGLSSGSSQKNLSPIQLSNIYVVYSEEYSDKMSELLAPSVEIIVQKYSENRKLASLRDWLLPMLMNGQIKVSD